MANAFKTFTANTIGFELTTIYTVGSNHSLSGSTDTLIGLTLANVTSGAVEANVVIANTSGSLHRIVANAPIAKGGALVPIGGEQKIVLENGAKLMVATNTANSVDVVCSVLEQT